LILGEAKENFVSAIHVSSHSYFDMSTTQMLLIHTLWTLHIMLHRAAHLISNTICVLKAGFTDMPGIREIWAVLRASALRRRKKRRNLDDVEMRDQSKSRRRAVLHLQLNLMFLIHR